MNHLDDPVLGPLTEAQRLAVQTIDGPLLMLAGPGSGKTRVITHRIAYMLQQGVPGRSVLALTFTNKAADEMRSRLERLEPENQVWMGTFHGFCARMLRIHGNLVGLGENFSIYDRDDAQAALQSAVTAADVELIMYSRQQVAEQISHWKNRGVTAEQFDARSGDPLSAIVGRVYPEYQRQLLRNNAVDFDDLLLTVVTLLRENGELRAQLDERYRYILVDEYQDTNTVQFALARALSIDHPNLAVTGDPDQSIYGWRGADVGNILDFEKHYPRARVVRLEQNYRSTGSILRVADHLITHNVRRKQKRLLTDNPDGDRVRLVIFPDGKAEADAIAARIANEVHGGVRQPADFAIFYRTNAMSRILEQSLREVEMPYQIVRGLEFYRRKEVKDVLAYLQLLNNPKSDAAMLRIINTPARSIGKTTITHLTRHARENKLALMDAAREAGLIESLAKRSAVAVATFVAMIDRLTVQSTNSLDVLLEAVLDETGYLNWLATSGTEEDRDRIENIEELKSDVVEFTRRHGEQASLEMFLEQAALVADVDDWDLKSNAVTLMTLHAAKGLEFPVVFIVGVEERFIPHEHSSDDPARYEEERRLLFVGITRAEQQLQLSMAQRRVLRGQLVFRAASPFLIELPRDQMEVVGATAILDYTPSEEFAAEWYDGQLDTGSVSETASPRSRAATKPRDLMASMTTAADLARSKTQTPAVNQACFRNGMVVNHPDYGLGKIVRLSGNGDKQTAAVRFFGGAGEKTFRLAFSPLQPVGSGN